MADAIQTTKICTDFLSCSGPILQGLGTLAWPAAILSIFVLFRARLIELVAAFVAQIRSGASLKVGAFELKGISREAIEKDLAGSHLAHAEPASAKDVDDRQNEYVRLRGLMLVHRIRPVLDEPGHFDISVYLLPHKGGALNQVKKVEYYFGPHWGGSQNGSRFVVEDPRDGFAMKIQAYGPALCMADILFHDKEQVISRQFRYLDFEMADAFRSQDSRAVSPSRQGEP